MSAVYLSEFEITDTYGIAHWHHKPKTVNIITGANGSGKSSILNALAYLVGGGSDPAIIRRGAKKSIVRGVFSNGEAFIKTTTPSGYRLEGMGPDGLAIPSPQKRLNELAELTAISPAELLALDARKADGRRKLAEALLRAMPFSCGPEDIRAAVPRAELLPGAPPVPHILEAIEELIGKSMPAAVDLDGLARLRKSVEETRRQVGAQVRDTDGTLTKLNKTLLPAEEAAADWPAHLRAAEHSLTVLTAGEAERLAGIVRDASTEREALQEEFAKSREAIQAEFNARMVGLQQARDGRLAAIAEAEAAAREQVLHASRPDRERIAADIATCREKAASIDRDKGSRELLAMVEQERAALVTRYDSLSHVLSALDAARLAKLRESPIPALEVTADAITYNGVPIHAVNLSQRAQLFVQVCTLRGGSLALMLMDDAEHLDSASREALIQALVEAGYQVIFTTVTDGPLSIQEAA